MVFGVRGRNRNILDPIRDQGVPCSSQLMLYLRGRIGVPPAVGRCRPVRQLHRTGAARQPVFVHIDQHTTAPVVFYAEYGESGILQRVNVAPDGLQGYPEGISQYMRVVFQPLTECTYDSPLTDKLTVTHPGLLLSF